MPSLRKHPKSPFWIACFTLPSGTRTNRSTGTSDKRKAPPSRAGLRARREGRLTESRARKTIASIYEMSNGEALPRSTVKDFLQSWLKRKETEAGEKTRIRYGVTVEQFTEFLGNRSSVDLMHLSHRDVLAFRDDLAKRLTPGTVNTSLKILRAALNTAKRDGFIDRNQAERVSLLSANAPNRRPFTSDELAKLLTVADAEWKTMVLIALYSGLRLGDICNLTWQNVDLLKGVIEIVVGKTEKPIEIPLAKKLLPHLQALPASDDPKQPLFPTAFAEYEKNYYNGLLSKRSRNPG